MSASMGPQPSSRGNLVFALTAVDSLTLQWGRNLPVAEIRLTRVPADGRLSRFNGAATFQSRKLAFCALAPINWDSASMGPQPSSRGNNSMRYAMGAGGMLQWGRNLPVAEIRNAAPPLVSMSLLQWGRNLPVAEIRTTSAREERWRWASMGPQPSSRGNSAEGAESERRADASMGPQPSSRGNATVFAAAVHRVGCFNGAATFQSRKSPAPKDRPRPSNRLQWGRNLPVAEMPSSLRPSMRPRPSLQWGRNLPVAEIGERGYLRVV